MNAPRVKTTEEALRWMAEFDLYLTAKTIQQALQGVGLYNGVIDGKWGPKSRSAYDEFNRRVG